MTLESMEGTNEEVKKKKKILSSINITNTKKRNTLDELALAHSEDRISTVVQYAFDNNLKAGWVSKH